MTAHNTCHGCGGLPVRTNGLEHHVIVVGPGRCTECSFHVATQGHRDCSSRTAPVYPDCKPDSLKPDSLTFLERITQRRRELNGEPNRCPPPRRTEDTGDIAQPGHNPAYVAAAIRGDLHRLAAATEGSRNHTLHSVTVTRRRG